MEENFDCLLSRVIDTLKCSDLESIGNKLKSIKGNSVIVSAGGSKVVSTFLSKYLKNSIVISNYDINYMDLTNIDNIIMVSYSGNNFVVKNNLNRDKNLYLFTNGDKCFDNVSSIRYENTLDKEHSFISLASTLMPISIINYCFSNLSIDEFINTIYKIFDDANKDISSIDEFINNHVYEIISGYPHLTATTFLETTFVESGLAIPLVHDKYDYCHGRSTISYNNDNAIIYFDDNKELDKVFLNNLSEYYNEIIKISSFDKLEQVREYYELVLVMLLSKKLSEKKGIDLSKVNYSPFVKKLYYFKGSM